MSYLINSLFKRESIKINSKIEIDYFSFIFKLNEKKKVPLKKIDLERGEKRRGLDKKGLKKNRWEGCDPQRNCW